MTHLPTRIGPRSTEIMQILWSHNRPLRVREVHKIMYQQHGLAYTTVMTTLVRLAEQGLLHRRIDPMRGHTYIYEPTCTPEAFVAHAVDQIQQQFGIEVLSARIAAAGG